MGSPKALLTYRGETFLDRLIGIFSSCCDQTVVVLGHGHEQILQKLHRVRSAEFVINPDPERGQLSSLQCGLRKVNEAGAIFFTPVDYPAFEATTVRALLPKAGTFAMPRYNGTRGHPVLIDRALADELLACQTMARDVIRAHTPGYVEVNDPGILEDVDDPAAYARLEEAVR
jgi:CTP:molybdopterin cytidylyltransferase MocA